MVTKTFDEIVQSFVTFLITRNELIDIKPTAITRTMVDSIANELAVVNAEIENVRRIQTVLNAVDMTIEELDGYGANFGVTRKQSTFSTVNVTFFLQNRPRTDVTILEGTVVATASDQFLGGSIQFATTAQRTIFADRIDSYFNPDTSFYEVTVPARSLVPGSSGNVAPNSVIRVVNSANATFASMGVTNKSSGTGGTDQEGNSDYAARILVSISGINVGTKDGYKSSALAVPGISDAIVVGAGDDMMVRDLNSLGQHIGGRVDVYVQGEEPEASQDRVAFALQERFSRRVNLIQGSTLGFAALESDLRTYPLISIDRVYARIANPALDFESQIDDAIQGTGDSISVVIVEPLNKSVIDGGINITVRAFKPDGVIRRVILMINREEANEMFFSNGLYSFFLNTAQYPDGILQLEAMAIDEQNRFQVTKPIQVTVQNLENVAVRILTPAPGSVIAGATNIQVFAFSREGIANQGVQIRFNDGRFMPMNPSTVANRFDFNFVAANFPSGSVKVDVRATDQTGKSAFAIPRYIVASSNPFLDAPVSGKPSFAAQYGMALAPDSPSQSRSRSNPNSEPNSTLPGSSTSLDTSHGANLNVVGNGGRFGPRGLLNVGLPTEASGLPGSSRAPTIGEIQSAAVARVAAEAAVSQMITNRGLGEPFPDRQYLQDVFGDVLGDNLDRIFQRVESIRDQQNGPAIPVPVQASDPTDAFNIFVGATSDQPSPVFSELVPNTESPGNLSETSPNPGIQAAFASFLPRNHINPEVPLPPFEEQTRRTLDDFELVPHDDRGNTANLRAIYIDPVTRIYWMGAEGTGLYISYDEGDSWKRVDTENTINFPSDFIRSINKVGDRIYIMTSKGIVTTADDGASFQLLNTGNGLPSNNVTKVAHMLPVPGE